MSIPKEDSHDGLKRIRENVDALQVAKFAEEEFGIVSAQDRKKRFNDPSEGWGVKLFEGLDDGWNNFL